MFSKISNWIAFKTLPRLVKVEMDSLKVKSLDNPDAKARLIYANHKDSFKKYGATLGDVRKIVDKESQIKKGLMAKMALKNATKSVHTAIQDGRIEFVTNDSIVYIDKQGKEFHYTFDEMADRLFENISGKSVSIPTMGNLSYATSLHLMGISSLDMRKIIDDEYNKVK